MQKRQINNKLLPIEKSTNSKGVSKIPTNTLSSSTYLQVQAREAGIQDKLSNPQETNKLDYQLMKNKFYKMKAMRKEKVRRDCEACSICQRFYRKQYFTQFGQCGHYFCTTCLTGYIQLKIKSFQIIKCPEEQCPQMLPHNSRLITPLGKFQEEKYYKILVSNNISKTPGLKLCPTEQCIGYIDLKQDPVTCPICEFQFCKVCLFQKHEGQCDQNGINYLQQYLLFKKCQRCKMILQKNQGCNHMTCKCGYQFCYLCGAQWKQNHKCSQQQQLNVQQRPSRQIVQTHNLPQIQQRIILQISQVHIQPQINRQQISQEHIQPQINRFHPTIPNSSCLCKCMYFLLVAWPICLLSAIFTHFLWSFALIFKYIALGIYSGTRNITSYPILCIIVFNIFLLLYCWCLAIGLEIYQQYMRQLGQIWTCENFRKPAACIFH